MADVLTSARYPADEVTRERARLVERLTIARSRAGVVAAESLARRMYGEHPYARELPQVADVSTVTRKQVVRLHAELVRPAGAVLVIVGDVSPARALDVVSDSLASWDGTGRAERVPALPSFENGPVVLVDRPGSVQSSLRLGGVALRRDADGYPALQLANLVFGGYFSSRWNENIREDKGYTYGPHSRIEHNVLGSSLVLDAEVATEVTAPALLETAYELGKISALPVTDGEVDVGAAVRDRHACAVDSHSGRTGDDAVEFARYRIGPGLDDRASATAGEGHHRGSQRGGRRVLRSGAARDGGGRRCGQHRYTPAGADEGGAGRATVLMPERPTSCPDVLRPGLLSSRRREMAGRRLVASSGDRGLSETGGRR